MCKVQMLRALVKQRLTAAAEEIFGLFEGTISEYEQEVCRLREDNERLQKLLDAVFKPQLQEQADDQQLVVVKEKVPSEKEVQENQENQENQDVQENQENQEEPEELHIKEEEEELWTNQEGEQLRGLEEADIKLTFTPVPVKSEEEDEEEPQSSQLHHMETDPDVLLQRAAQNRTSGSSIFGLVGRLQKQTGIHTAEKPFSCSFCGKKVASRSQLTNHIRVHTGEKPFTCSVCKTSFATNGSLVRHMRIHTGEKPFSCSVCGKRLANSSKLTIHLRVHTGEKPFACSVCRRNFSDSGNLVKHMRIHTGEKPYGCSVCGSRFRQKQTLRRHLAVHTGERPCPRSAAAGGSENTSEPVTAAEGDEAVEVLVDPFLPAD